MLPGLLPLLLQIGSCHYDNQARGAAKSKRSRQKKSQATGRCSRWRASKKMKCLHRLSSTDSRVRSQSTELAQDLCTCCPIRLADSHPSGLILPFKESPWSPLFSLSNRSVSFITLSTICNYLFACFLILYLSLPLDSTAMRAKISFLLVTILILVTSRASGPPQACSST